MSLYEFTQALLRQRVLLAWGFGALLVITLFLTFSIDDGDLGWRFGPRYEASIRIAVVAASQDSLTEADLGPGNFVANAQLYGEMLNSTEAAVAVGESNGYELDDLIDVRVPNLAPLIEASVIGPTETQATGAALAAFDWLVEELRRPPVAADLPTTTTTVPPERLQGVFDSTIQVSHPATFSSLPEGLFVLLDTGLNSQLAYDLSESAGEQREFEASLSRQMSLVVGLQDPQGRQSGTVRLGVPPLPAFVDELPALGVVFRAGAVTALETEDDEELPWALDPELVSLEWVEGTPLPGNSLEASRDVKLVLLTPSPEAAPIGERRGPIITLAFLIVGSLALLAAATVVDAWRKELEARQATQAAE